MSPAASSFPGARNSSRRMRPISSSPARAAGCWAACTWVPGGKSGGILPGMSEGRLYVVREMGGAIYGPANPVTLRQWIGEGRITKQMHVAPQGTADFVEAGRMPELAG